MHTILLHPLHPDQLFVSNQSSTCYLMNMNGQVIKALQSGKRQGGGKEALCRKHQAGMLFKVAVLLGCLCHNC